MIHLVNLRMNTPTRPPVYALLVDLTGWTLDRTATLPRSHRFTFGERIDRLTLDCLELMIEAIFATPNQKEPPLRQANLNLEKLRIFWRLVHDRQWISAQQLLFVSQKLDEIGRMLGGWLKSLPNSSKNSVRFAGEKDIGNKGKE
jgi:hypothetical protein